MKRKNPRFACARGGTSKSGVVVAGVRLVGGSVVARLADEVNGGTLLWFELTAGMPPDALA